MKEQWKKHPTLPVECSTEGRVRAYSNHPTAVEALSQWWSRGDVPYLNVQVGISAYVNKTYRVHKLMIETFEGERPGGMQCMHLDGDRANNKPSNLRWGTVEENNLMKPNRPGRQKNAAKLNIDIANEIRELWSQGLSIKDVAARYGVHFSTVSKIIGNKSHPNPNWHYERNKEQERARVSAKSIANGIGRKLSEEQVREIFRLQSEGVTQKVIAAQMGIGRRTLCNILYRVTYKWVEI